MIQKGALKRKSPATLAGLKEVADVANDLH
jgi:hypothetical protein